MGQSRKIGTEVTLRAVYDGSEENKQYFRYTPNGVITLGILNEPAAKMFEPGQEYYVDFSSTTDGVGGLTKASGQNAGEE